MNLHYMLYEGLKQASSATMAHSGIDESPEPTDTSVPSIRVEVCAHPFASKRDTYHLDHALTVCEILDYADLPVRPTIRYGVTIDGVPVPESEWEWLTATDAQVVTIRAVPRDGGSKNIGAIIIGVLLVTAAVLLAGGSLGSASPFSLAIGSMGVSLILGGIAGLIAPATARPKGPSGGEDNLLVSSITGIQNRANPFGTIPRNLGYHKIYPPLGASPYTELFDNDQYIRMLFVLGYGPLEVTDVRIGETLIDEFDDVEWDVSEGRVGDGNPAYYTKDVTEEAFNIALLAVDSWQSRTSTPLVDELIVDIVAPSGLLHIQKDGDRKQVVVIVEIQYAVKDSGSWVAFDMMTLAGTTANTIRRSSRKTVAVNQYDVRVRRVTADSTGNQTSDLVFWTVLRSVRLQSPVSTTKHLSMISLRIRATNQLNGVINQLNCTVKSYLQVYNGATWNEELSNNPAWCFASVLTDQANEDALPTSRLDAAGLLEWATWCSANGFYYNKTIDSKRTVFEMLREISAAGRAVQHMKDSSVYSVVRDIAQTVPIQHITPRNSWDYSGTKAFIPRIHALRCSFLNEDEGYQQDERMVYSDGYSVENATVFEALPMPGITNADQVWKLGRYHLAQIILRPEVHTVHMDAEALVCSKGDLVEMVHEVPKFGLGAARITQLTEAGDSLVGAMFDELWIHEAAKTYAVRIRKHNGASLLLNVQTIVAHNEGVTFSTPLVADEEWPEVGDLIMFGEQALTTIRMLIKTIEPQSPFEYLITLVDEAPEVLTAAGGTIPPFDPHISLPAKGDLLVPPTPAIVAFTSDETIMDRGADGTLRPRLGVSLFIPGNTQLVGSYFFQIQYRLSMSGDPWIQSPLFPIDQGQAIVDQVEDGATYEIRARTTTGTGYHSPWTATSNHTIVGKSSTPPDVTTILVTKQSDGTREFSWTLVDPPADIDGFILRFKLGTDGTWIDSSPLHTGVIKASPWETNQLAAGQYTMLIKAVDTSGNESDTAKAIISTLGDPRLAGALIQLNCRAVGWPGIKTDCFVDTPGDLIASDTKTWADFDTDGIEWADWDQWNRLPANPIIYEHLVLDLGAVITFTPLVTFTGTGTPSITEAHSDDDVTYTAFAALTGVVTARYFKIKVSVSDSRPLFSNLIIIADAAAIVDDLFDIDTSTLAGTTGDRTFVTTKPFTFITSVGLAFQNVGAGFSYEIINKTVTGPRLKLYNASGTLVDATVDVVIRGLA